MALTIGTRIGSLEITGLLGKGGMGEVYRARDTKLKREVAIKIIPDEFSLDHDRVSRFQREAEVLASLNHPNIAAIHSLEEASGARFLVLELVEGETLAERIRRGALPIDEALQIAKGICEALEAAHEKGVIHRDLKPANVKVTPDGKVKVLDFGLAKALDKTPASGNLSQSPTMSMASFAATQAGVILGTAAYMSPEQAKGLNTDQRSDIFSFGAVLYEMLTGRQAFQGDSVSEVLASILAREPDLGLVPSSLNPRIRELLRRALEKNPRRRWHAIGDLRMEMEAVLADPRGAIVAEQGATRPKPLWKRVIPVAAAVVLTAAISSAAMWYFRPVPPPVPVRRFSVLLAEGQQFSNPGRTLIAISPDGTEMVYVANQRLFRRPMSELEARPIPGAESATGVTSPTFSPDGRSLVFWSAADQMIKKIALSGGAAVPLCPAINPFGMSWDDDGIVFGQGDKGILRVSVNGGTPEVLVSVKQGELAYGSQILPGGQTLLYTIAPDTGADQWDKAQIVVQELKPGSKPVPIIPNGSDARYLSTEHIVYAFGGTLFAVPFDLKTLKVTGDRVPVLEGVRRAPATTGGVAQFSVSEAGALIYLPGPAGATGADMILARMGRNGGIEPLKLPPKPYAYPRFSRDGTRVAFSTDYGKDTNVWIYDLDGTAQPKQLTRGGVNRYPVWSPDGKHVAFQSDREGDPAIWLQRADFTGTAERLTKPEKGVAHIPDSWSPHGQLSFSAAKGFQGGVWTYSLQDRKATVFREIASALIGRSAFSPDGQWLAYQSNETTEKGRNQIFVEPFPATDTRHLIFAGGQPFWSDKRELFYVVAAGRMAFVTVNDLATFSFGDPVAVPDGLSTRPPVTSPRFADITLDGKTFIGVVSADYQASAGTPAAPEIQVVLGWYEVLKQRMATP